MSSASRRWLSVLFVSALLLLLVQLRLFPAPVPLAQAAPPSQSNPTSTEAGAADAAAQAEEDKGSWPQWEALPVLIKAKVDPRILAEFRGAIIPAYVHNDLGNAGEPLLDQPRPRAQTRFIVYLRQQADLTQVAQAANASQIEQRQAIFSTLVETAQSAQTALRSALDADLANNEVLGYQSFYIVNAVAVEGNLPTLIRLAQRADVERIAANYPLVAPFDGLPTQEVVAAEAADASLDFDNWNIELVGADRVWNELGIRGEGAVVAGFDTGVTYRHPALVKNYRGNLQNGKFDHNYNWFEPDGQLYANGNLGPSVSVAPRDCHPHGTHTMGTSVGDGGKAGTQIGMAPAAQWIALPGICGNTMPGGLEDDIGALKAFQWVLCPTDLSGDLATADCSKAPDAVNNSWGSANPTNDVLRPAIQRLRVMGVAPVFAAGNPWAGPGSIGTPANAPEAITVGATNRFDQVAYFSGRGPSFYASEQKPELSAPGVDVVSSVFSSEYYGLSGTSMAAPHVTGLIALMVAADLRDGVRDFSVDELERFMELTAVDLGDPGADNDYGYGRINAYEAVRWVLTAGDLRGNVRDAATGQTIAAAQIKVQQVGAAFDFATHSGPTGAYSTTVPAGAYQLTVEAWGYATQVFDAQVFVNSLAVADLVLQPQPTSTLQGVVRIEGAPVANALISVQGATTLTMRSNADGSYNLTVPVGAQKLKVQAPGARVTQVDLLVTPGQLSYDFALTRAPSILLVDADAYGGWFFSWSVINVFRWALDQQNYTYDLWRIQYPDEVDTHVQTDGSTGYGVPSSTTMRQYDVVIWAHSGCGFGFFGCSFGGSPQGIGADAALMEYLDQGGKLILSGQNIGEQEDGSTFFDDYLQADWLGEAGVEEEDTLSGKDFLQNLSVKLTNASLYGYNNGFLNLTPDAVAPGEGNGVATPILLYEKTQETAALAVSSCQANYRAIYFAMGYENIGPRADTRDPAVAALLDKSIAWTLSSKPAYSFGLTVKETEHDSQQGRTVAYTARLVNAGVQPLTVQMALSNQTWPTRIYDGSTQLTGAVQLAPCENRTLTVLVDVPATAANGSQNNALLTATVAEGQIAAQSANLVTTAFAPWEIQRPSLRERYGAAATVLPGAQQIYVIGGRLVERLSDGTPVTTDRTDLVESYNPCSGQWRTHAPLPQARSFSSAAVLQGKIYVLGGYVDDGFGSSFTPKSVFVYDPAQNRWSKAADLPHYSIDGITMAAANGKLYAFGGYNDTSFIAGNPPTYEYDPATNRWSERAPMLLGRSSSRKATELNGKIYVIGGYFGTGELDQYDPASNSWTTLTSLTSWRSGSSITGAADGYLYAIGSDNFFTEAIENATRYNPQTNGWGKIPALNDTRRTDSAAVYAAGRVFAIGGYGVRSPIEALAVADSFCLSTQQASSNAAAVGGSVTYSVTLKPDVTALTNARFSSQLPVQGTFGGFQGNPAGAVYDPARHRVEWRGGLAAAGPVRFGYRLNFTVDPQTSGARYHNLATFDNGLGAVFTRTLPVAVLLPDFANSGKAVDRAMAATGDTMTYALQVRGRNMVGGAMQVRDPLPAGIEYVPDSLSYTTGSGAYDPATRSIVWQGAVPPSPYINIGNNYVFGDSDGNGEVPQANYNWIELRGSGEEVGNGDVLVVCDLPIGFSFEFYDTKQSTFCVSANGFISFNPNTLSGSRNECPIGQQESFFSNTAVVAAVWGDLRVEDQIRYQTLGTAPNRYLVIQWSGVRSYYSFSNRLAEFELILHENSTIQMQVRDIGGLGSIPFSTGVKNYDNTLSATYACNRSGALHNKLAVNFVPPGGGSSEAAADVRFRVRTGADVGVNKNLVNTATFSTLSGNFERSATTLMNPVDLGQTEIEVNKPEVTPNEEVTYQLTLRNSGLLTATSASATMTLPVGLTYVENSLTCSIGQCSFAAGVMQWSGPVAPHGTVNLAWVARLTTPLADLTPLRSMVQVADGFGNQYALPITIVSRRADLHFSYVQVVPDFVDPGESATVVAYARNTGRLATTAQMEISVPAGMTFEPNSLSCGLGTCSYNAGVITWNGALDPRITTPIRFRIKAPEGAAYGERYTGSITLKDMQWGDSYTYPTALWVAHGFYFAPVMAPKQQFFLPAVFQHYVAENFVPIIPIETLVPVEPVPLATPTPVGP